MEKPFRIKLKEIKEEIIEIINNSKMPAYVLIKLFEEICNELEQYDLNEIKKYEQNKGSDKNDIEEQNV